MNEDLINRITYYLSSGGLFNPELADHLAVRNLLMECRDALAQPEQDGKCKYCTDGCPACDASKLPEQKSVAMADYMALTEKYVALKAAQPEQKPMHPQLKAMLEEYFDKCFAESAPQRTWVGLTNEEIDYQAKKDDHGVYFALGALWAGAKLKEKNT